MRETINALIQEVAHRSSQRGKRYFIDSEKRYIRAIQAVIYSNDSRFWISITSWPVLIQFRLSTERAPRESILCNRCHNHSSRRLHFRCNLYLYKSFQRGRTSIWELITTRLLRSARWNSPNTVKFYAD